MIKQTFTRRQEWLKLTDNHIAFLAEQKSKGISRSDVLTTALDRYMKSLERKQKANKVKGE